MIDDYIIIFDVWMCCVDENEKGRFNKFWSQDLSNKYFFFIVNVKGVEINYM